MNTRIRYINNTSDCNKRPSAIRYNNIGLVDSIVFNSGAKVVYVYSMTGEKLRVRHYAAPPTVTSPSISPFVVGGDFNPQRPWVGSESYEEDMYYGDDVICSTAFYGYTYRSPIYKYYFGNGYLSFTADVSVSQPVFSYFSKDHLGNIRSVVRKYPDSGDVTELQKTHYYPFGGVIADISSGRNVQNRLYNGKEQDFVNNLFWLDYGARQYDPTRGQFTNYDQHCESYYNTNPLTYCHNRPNMMIDPNGMDDYYSYNGKYLYTDDKETDHIMIGGGVVSFEFPDASFEITVEGTPIEETELTAEAYSNIFTDILSKMEDVDTSQLYNGSISISKDLGDDIHFAVFNDPDIEIDVAEAKNASHQNTESGALITSFITSNSKSLYSTRSNVQNLLGAHEFISHHLNKMSDGLMLDMGLKTHYSWDKTTPEYKRHVNERINSYIK